MRDEVHIREKPVSDGRGVAVVLWTLAALSCLGASFGLGYMMGGRMARMDIANTPVVDSLAKLDAQRKIHNDLTFYEDLTAKNQTRQIPTQTVELQRALMPSTPAAGSNPPVSTHPTASERANAGAVRPTTPLPVAAKSNNGNSPVARVTAPSKTAPGLYASGPAHAGEYTIQVSSYASMDEARAFSSSLERQGFRPFIVKTELARKGTWYRVRMGRFATAEHAQKAKSHLSNQDIPAWIVQTE